MKNFKTIDYNHFASYAITTFIIFSAGLAFSVCYFHTIKLIHNNNNNLSDFPEIFFFLMLAVVSLLLALLAFIFAINNKLFYKLCFLTNKKGIFFYTLMLIYFIFIISTLIMAYSIIRYGLFTSITISIIKSVFV